MDISGLKIYLIVDKQHLNTLNWRGGVGCTPSPYDQIFNWFWHYIFVKVSQYVTPPSYTHIIRWYLIVYIVYRYCLGITTCYTITYIYNYLYAIEYNMVVGRCIMYKNKRSNKSVRHAICYSILFNIEIIAHNAPIQGVPIGCVNGFSWNRFETEKSI